MGIVMFDMDIQSPSWGIMRDLIFIVFVLVVRNILDHIETRVPASHLEGRHSMRGHVQEHGKGCHGVLCLRQEQMQALVADVMTALYKGAYRQPSKMTVRDLLDG